MASDSEQPSGNSKDSQKENENLTQPSQSTDDYFENVNRRLKKKSRFGFGKTDKKETAPKKQTPPPEVKVEVPEVPVVVDEPKEEEVKTETVKAEPVVEAPPPVEVVEQQPVETVEPEPVTVEPEPQVVETPKEPEIVKPPITETTPEPQNVETNIVEPQPVAAALEPEQVQSAVPDIINEPIPEITVEPKKVEKPKPKKRSLFGFLHRPKIFRKRTELFETGESVIQTEEDFVASSGVAEVAAVQVTEQVVAVESVKPSDDSLEEGQINSQAPFFDGIVHIGKYTKEDNSRFPQKAVLSIGEYPVHLLLKSRFASKPDGVLPLFIDKSSQDIIKEAKNQVDPDYIIGLDEELDAHFWFNILPNVSKDSPFSARLQSKPIRQLRRALIVASIWDGVGSALLPTMASQFNEQKISSAALALFPSKVQSLESQFNAFAAVGKCALQGSTPIVLLDRENIENYLGVDRKGNMIKGSKVINYLVDMMLSRETLVDEFSELTRTFDSPVFTLIFGTGASIRLYGSIENILDTLLFKQFLSIDISSAELLYVLVRMPYHLKDKVPRAKIELATANWFKDKATLKSIYVTEPVYVEDNSDRIDIALFIGSFDTTKIFGAIEKRVATMKNKAIKNGFIQEDEWKEIVQKLTS
jgi:hypothetical protein